MNNQGWGLQIMLFFCACFVLALIVATSIFNKSFTETKKQNTESATSYYNLEVKLTNAAKNYIKENYNDIDDITMPIRLSTLKQKNYIGTLRVNNTECNGYVIFIKENNNVEYNPYLKCGSDYITNGFELKYVN